MGLTGEHPGEPAILCSQFNVGSALLELLNIYSLIIIARVIVSWVGLDPSNRIVRFLRAATDPILVPIQNVVPPIGGSLDISPIIALFFVYMLKWVVIRVF
jgi:YggT family protein